MAVAGVVDVGITGETGVTTYVIDFDSTLISVESLDSLAELALSDRADARQRLAQLSAITSSGMCGGLPFNESLRQRLALFEANREHVELLAGRLGALITPSAVANSDWFRHNAERVFVVSGGFEEYIVPTVALLGIDPSHVFANRFTYDDQGSITGFDESRPTSQPGGKALQVAALALARPVVAIGDGSTDLEIRASGQADEFWAYTAHVSRPGVADKADSVFDDFALLAQL